METSGGFSSIVVFFIIIVFAVILTTSGSHDDHVNNKGGLTPDEYGILKVMMDRCVEIFVDPLSSPPIILQGDAFERVQKLNMFRCNEFFDLVRWSFYVHGTLSPDYVHELKEEVPNLLPRPSHSKLKKEVPNLLPWPSHKFGDFLDSDNNFKHSFKKSGGILSDEDNHPHILKPMMENCVKHYLDNADPEKLKPSDIDMCHDFFWKLGYFYRCNEEKLEPEHVEILKEHPWLDELDGDVSEYQRCLKWEKHGLFYQGPCYCEGVRKRRISKGLSL